MVSVVVPAYNAERTINRIINQVFIQSYQNIELIIINDGSCDNTLKVIKEHAENPKIKIIDQDNSGVSVARNNGIRLATGKYITFIDADDEIKPHHIRHMVEAAEIEKCDLVIAGYEKYPGKCVKLKRKTFFHTDYNEIIMTRDIGVAISKLYDLNIIRKGNIEFPKGMKLSEDAVFYYRYLRHSERAAFIDAQDYMYYAPPADTKYALSARDEIAGLNFMQQAIITLLKELRLDGLACERLRARLMLHVNRAVGAVISRPRDQRNLLYQKIGWSQLLPYMHSDIISKYLLGKGKFQLFEWWRLINAKILRKNLQSIIN